MRRYHKPRIKRRKKGRKLKGRDAAYLLAKIEEIRAVKAMGLPHPFLGWFKNFKRHPDGRITADNADPTMTGTCTVVAVYET